MGNVIARELKNARIDFVSFVDRGANGRQFQIFKNANAELSKAQIKTPIDENQNIELSEKNFNMFSRFYDFFKSNKNTEEKLAMVKEMTSVIKSLKEGIDGLCEKVNSLDKKIDEKIIKSSEQPSSDLQTEGTSSEKSKMDENTLPVSKETAKKKDPPAPLAEEEKKAGDSEYEKLNKTVSELVEKLSTVSLTVDKVVQKRSTSNQLDIAEIKKNEQIDEVSYENIF